MKYGWTIALWAFPIALVSVRASFGAGAVNIELKAVPPYPDPHHILVKPGDTVQIGYYIDLPIAEFSAFQTDLSLLGPVQLSCVRRGTWLSGGGVYDSAVHLGTSGAPDYFRRVLGYCLQSPTFIGGSGDLAVLDIRFDGPGAAQIDAGAGYTELVDADGNLFAPVSGDSVVQISPGAGPIFVELRAIGPYPDPHHVQLGYGNTVDLGYYVVQPVTGLSGFQTDVGVSGGGELLGAVRGDWFSGGGTFDSDVADGGSGPPDDLYRVLGYCLQNPASLDGAGDMAIIPFRYDGPGTVTINAAAGYTELVDEGAALFQPVYGDVAVTVSRHPCDCYDVNGDREIWIQDLSVFSASYGSIATGTTPLPGWT